MEKPTCNEKPDILTEFAKKVSDEKNKGRSLVFVDDRLLEWVDEQVDAGKYRSRSDVIECALTEFMERRKNNILPNWNNVDEADRRYAIRLLVDLKKVSLGMFLNEHFGDDLQAKIDRLKKRVKDGSLTAIEVVAIKEVLANLDGKRARG